MNLNDYNEIRRRNAARYFDGFIDIFDLFGFNDAAEKLRYYRSGQGGSLILNGNEMVRHPIYGEAVDKNRTRFESSSFTGNSKNGNMWSELMGIPDGGSRRIKDDWDVNVNTSGPATYLNFGRFSVNSDGNFDVARKGDKFTWSGVVDHRLGANDKNKHFIPERFDFNPGQPGSGAAEVAERYGAAKPFDMAYPNRQRVDAQVVYDPTPTEQFPNGCFTVERVDWRPLGEGPGGRGWWD